MLDEILEIAVNDDGKHKVHDLGLIQIKDKVRKDQSGSASHAPPSNSNVPPSTSNVPPSHSSLRSLSARSTTKASMSCKMLSLIVARQRGLNWLKEKSKKPLKARATQTAPYYFPCMDGTQQSIYVPAQFTQMQTVDNIGGTSHTQSGMVNNISSQIKLQHKKQDSW
ncbi:hypothetical protein CsSME_00022777 [Camellia sinensis var. sinensis]